MDVTLSWPALSALAAWATVVITLLGWLFKRFADLEAKLSAHVAALEIKLAEHARENMKEHQAMRAQVGDITLTMADNYVRQRDWNAGQRAFNETMSELRKEVGAVHNRIDELFRDQRRFRGDC